MDYSHKLAWAAGFIDGEGYITIGRRGAYKGRKGHYLRVGVNHVAKEPLYLLKELFGGSLEFQKKESVTGNRIPRTRWITNSKKAANTLKLLLPYLVNKIRVAELGIEFQSTMSSNKAKTSDEIYKKRVYLKEEITRLNSLD